MNQHAQVQLKAAAIVTLLTLTATPAIAQVERYKVEAEYLARLAELNLETVTEGFESALWDGTRSSIVNPASLPEVTSNAILWEPAAADVWGGSFQFGLSSNGNWARSGSWGLYESHFGVAYPTTIRVSTETPIYGVGGWFNTNPDGQSVGFLFEDRTTANEPGYYLPGFGAMYPGDNPAFGHEFIGIIDPAGFSAVILTGTLEVNEKGRLEGGTIYGADDFTFAVPIGFGVVSPDFSGDGCVDSNDLATLLAAWGEPTADLTADGITDSADLAVLLAAWTGSACTE